MLFWSLTLLVSVQGSPLQEKPASARDYAIYKRVLESLPERANLDNSLVQTPTVTRDATFRRTALRTTPKERPDSVLLDSLASGSEAFTPHTLDAAGFGRTVRFITDSAFRSHFHRNPQAGWSTLRAKYPGLHSVIELSNVAYNQAGDSAVVYVAVKCGPRCGRGQLYYLAQKDDLWTITRVVMEWIS